MKKMTGAEILALPMERNDSGANTIGGYLKALLLRLWEEGEGFSGKHPFGNSGWTTDLAKPLVVAGVISGRLDADGYVDDYRESECRGAIQVAIDALA
jgi:hypothetical protein